MGKGKSFYNLILILAIVTVVFSLLDAVTTYSALQKSGTYETNPTMEWVINSFGWFWLFIVKLFIAYLVLPFKYCGMYYAFNYFKKQGKFYDYSFKFFIVIAYLFLIYKFLNVSINNLKYIK